MTDSNETVSQRIEELLQSGDQEEIKQFLRNPPPEIEEDERLHQKTVVLHDRIGAVDPLVSAHVYWQRNKRATIVDHRVVGNIMFTITASSVLDQPDADYIVAACDAMLDPGSFPQGGLLQHIQWLEGSNYFEGPHHPPQPLDFLGLWEIASIMRTNRYLFINMEKNAQRTTPATLTIFSKGLTDVLNTPPNIHRQTSSRFPQWDGATLNQT